ncbi:MAG: SDR family oxidoreductase [Candidatus Sericytochromatia bacterium]|nr:SDR family oxidoreductase [Candidatus Sericytochromatia bacterium]
MQLAGKTVLVTGAAHRIGRAIALDLAAAGADMIVHAHRSIVEAEALAAYIQSTGRRAWALAADLADPAAVQDLAVQALALTGRVDVLVNNAAIFERTPLAAAGLADWDRHMAVNVRAPWLLAQALAPAMQPAGAGKIINLTDYLAVRPVRDYVPYQVSKAALNGLTLALAKAYAPTVQVNAVALGPILPAAGMDDAEQEKLIRRLPLQRWGSPDDVVKAVHFLIAEADFATGSTLSIDGGSMIR